MVDAQVKELITAVRRGVKFTADRVADKSDRRPVEQKITRGLYFLLALLDGIEEGKEAAGK